MAGIIPSPEGVLARACEAATDAMKRTATALQSAELSSLQSPHAPAWPRSRPTCCVPYHSRLRRFPGLRALLPHTKKHSIDCRVPSARSCRGLPLMRLPMRRAVQMAVGGSQDLQTTQALHTYYRVSAVGSVSVRGLQGTPYLNNLAGRSEAPGAAEAVTFAEEVDRIYINTGVPSTRATAPRRTAAPPLPRRCAVTCLQHVGFAVGGGARVHMFGERCIDSVAEVGPGEYDIGHAPEDRWSAMVFQQDTHPHRHKYCKSCGTGHHGMVHAVQNAWHCSWL